VNQDALLVTVILATYGIGYGGTLILAELLGIQTRWKPYRCHRP
jgi:hypothetical protein